jgi:ANTAR domain-containing protein
MDPTVEQPAPVVPAVLPHDVVCTPSGQPAALVVRSGRGWTVLSPEDDGAWADVSGRVVGEGEALSLVEAMSLADLVAAEHGSSPEPGRDARRAARTASGPADDAAAAPPVDPRDEEITALRRTIGQLEHALAARVSIERAIGVLAERHGTTPREAFEALRRNARSQGRAAQELATEVLDGLPAAHPAGPQTGSLPAAEPRPVGVGSAARRVQRGPRRAGSGDVLPGASR